MPDVLIIAEFKEGQPTDLTLELICLGRRLCGSEGKTLTVAALGTEEDQIDGMEGYGADQIITVRNQKFSPYNAEAWMPDVMMTIGDVSADVILLGHTTLGSDLAPRLAFRSAGAVITNATSVEIGALDEVFALRGCFGGKAQEWVQAHVRPAVITIKPKSQNSAVPELARSCNLRERPSILGTSNMLTKVIHTEPRIRKAESLSDSELIVAGGRGVKGTDGFELLGRLAELIGASIGGSRVACDFGWCPTDRQIGLTGATVKPKLYIAFGISGASQHMTGCAGAQIIVAINNDRAAPIFDFATYGIVADCREIAMALIDAMERCQREDARTIEEKPSGVASCMHPSWSTAAPLDS